MSERISEERLIELWNNMSNHDDEHDCIYHLSEFNSMFSTIEPLALATMIGRSFSTLDNYFTFSKVFGGYISFTNVYEVVDVTTLMKYYNTRDLNSINIEEL